MAIYEQILSILAAHPKGLPIDGIMAVAAKMPRNEIRNKAALSQNLYGLRNGVPHVAYVGDGYKRNYVITHNGKQRLVGKGYDLDKLAVPIFGVDVGLPDKADGSTGSPRTGAESSAELDPLSVDKIEHGNIEVLFPLNGGQSPPKEKANNPNSPLTLNDLRQVLDGYALHPCVRNKARKTTLLQTLADLCMDTGTGVMLLEIKADLEAMGGVD